MNLQSLQTLDPDAEDYAIRIVDILLAAAMEADASDIHITQRDEQIDLSWRQAGRLVTLPSVRDGSLSRIMSRVKAMAHLVTYRSDIPQEGRLTVTGAQGQLLEARVGTLPTLRGERAVIRLSKQQWAQWRIHDLGLPPATLARLESTLNQRSGAILICGPAGAGKTTSAYACLRTLGAAKPPRTIVTLEDPVEQELTFAAQSEVEPARDYGWSDGLRAILRQDPEVLLIGEIRDAETATVVFQAALTGQLVLTTMHARSAADALRRLLDMGVPAHHVRSALDLLICQRLDLPQSDPAADASVAAGAVLTAEHLPPIDGALAKAVVQDADTVTLHTAACELGMQPLERLQARQTQAATGGDQLKVPLHSVAHTTDAARPHDA